MQVDIVKDSSAKLLTFPGGIPNDLQSVEIPKDLKFLASNLQCRFEPLELISDSDSADLCKYAVGIYDSKTKKLKIVHADGLIPMKQRLLVQERKDAQDRENEMKSQEENIRKRKQKIYSKDEIQSKLSALADSFGNKKSQKIMRQRSLGKDLDVQASSSVAALERAVESIKRSEEPFIDPNADQNLKKRRISRKN
jgi:hypothetical protein